jgi:hypothetical protein
MACTYCIARIKARNKVQIEAIYTATGRCCISGDCTITTEGGCAGSWWGSGTVCGAGGVDNWCLSYGACCTGESCLVVNTIDCEDVYLGDWTNCDGDPCDDPIGSCCNGGVCVVTTEGNCAGGNWTVTGDCDPNPCPDNPRVLSFF